MTNVDLIASYWTIAGQAYPHTDREYSPFDLRDRAEKAAEVGFKGLGLWHADLMHILQTRSFKDIQKILDDTGLYLELEFLTDWFWQDERRKKADELWKVFMQACDETDVRQVKIGDFSGEPCPMPQIIDAFGELCADAAKRDVDVLYEFMPFGNIHTQDGARQLVEGAAARNGGVILDLWHIVFMDIDYDQLAQFPAQYVLGVELNDGPAQKPADLHDHTVNHRQFCGDGEFDIPGFLDCLKQLGYTGPYGIEVLNAEWREKSLDTLVTYAYDTTVAQFR